MQNLGPVTISKGGYRSANPGTLILASLFAQACLVSIIVGTRTWAAEPFGGWDGWAIWGLHARLMFFGGDTWTGFLHSPQIGWTHPDYPLLLPAAVARAWSLLAQAAPEVPAMISMFFGIGTVGLLFAAVTKLRGWAAALIGGLVLLGTPFFVTFSLSQYADVPLGYFILATFVMMALSERNPESRGMPALAGVVAGMAAWTKNEGWLFVLVAGLVWCVGRSRRESFRSCTSFCCGLAVALLPVLYLKIAIAPPNDLVGRPMERLGYLFDGARHRLILAAFWRHGAQFGEWRFAPYLALLLPLFSGRWRRLTRAEWSVGAMILLMLVGYYVAYLMTPRDLSWQLTNSIDRLLLQLWPSTLFFWCLAAFGEETSDFPPARFATAVGVRPRTMLGTAIGINLVAACLILSAFTRQLARNELAAIRDAAGDVHAIIGMGWFGRERDSRDVWAWSSGPAILWLAPGGRQRVTTVTLRFGMRSLGDRTVTAKIGDRIVWSARIGERQSQAEFTAVLSKGRATDVVFSTDEPGVRESSNSSARLLAFAIYNLRLAEGP